MKLKDILREAEADELEEFASMLGAESCTRNQDGTVDIVGDVFISGPYDQTWPKIRYVDGSLGWLFIPEKYNLFEHLPKFVRGDVEIPIGEHEIKSSQLPKSHGGAGVLKLTTAVEGKSKIILDDTTLFTYSNYVTEAPICGGFEFIPPEWTTTNAIMITKEDLSNLSTSIVCNYFSLTTDNPATMKGIHKKIKSIRSEGPVEFIFPDKSPILGLLRVCQKQDLWTTVLNTSRNSPQNQHMRRLMNKLVTDGTDSLDAQDTLIDAGFGSFAKL